jgi:chromate reductase, NAD(P)H dehydrogenase (quinone)
MMVLLVSGSTRTRSTNTAALRTAQAVAPDGITTVLYEGLVDLPAFIPDSDPENPHPAVAELRQNLVASDAVLFCTPEYAGTLPGSFKNALDWTVGTGELYEKPVAWISVAAPGRGDGAEATLRTVLGYVAAQVIEPACVRIPVQRDQVGPDGELTGDPTRTQIAGVLAAMADYLTSI